MHEKKSEIFYNNLFQCSSFTCHCEKDIENIIPGEPPKTTLKLFAKKDQPLNFSYVSKEGLNLTGIAGGTIERNILGKLLSIPEDNIDKHIEFFQQYGFLFPISTETYESVDAISLIETVNRIKATVHLMNAIAGKINYKNILIFTTYLLFSQPITLQLDNYEYHTCSHDFSRYINSYNNFRDINRDPEVFLKGSFSVIDTLVGKTEVSAEFFNAVRSNAETLQPGADTPWFKNIVALYTSFPTTDHNLRIIIDFYYHYMKDVAIIKNVAYGHLSYWQQKEEDNYTDEMKKALLEIARIVVSAEINHNITGIHPRYEADAFAPSWQVDTLIQALYFSIFYMKPGIEIYKECKNPNCKRDKYFLIEATRTNKEYCSIQCSRAAAAQRYRNRKLNK